MKWMRMAYWLMKSEPQVYSIDDLQRERKTGWDGIRNYQARKHLMEMKKGDHAFFYHSNARPPAIVGIVKIITEAYPDPSQFDPRSHYFDAKSDPSQPRWVQVEVKFVKKFAQAIPLDRIKTIKKLQQMQLIRLGRLSVQKVSASEWDILTQFIE